jgi:transcriptional/translational regulatory protein YebC/TACO1
MFDRLGQITYARAAGSDDEVMEAAIEAGAEDVESDEDGHTIYTAFESQGEVLEALEAALGAARSTGIVWKAKTQTPVGSDEATILMKLIDALDDDDDVQAVWGNYELSDADMERLAG